MRSCKFLTTLCQEFVVRVYNLSRLNVYLTLSVPGFLQDFFPIFPYLNREFLFLLVQFCKSNHRWKENCALSNKINLIRHNFQFLEVMGKFVSLAASSLRHITWLANKRSTTSSRLFEITHVLKNGANYRINNFFLEEKGIFTKPLQLDFLIKILTKFLANNLLFLIMFCFD